MANSIGSKEELIDFSIPGTVLDVGAGGGELSAKYLDRDFEVHSLDSSRESLEYIKKKSSKLEVHKGKAEDLADLFPKGFFDNVVFSSVLHEVYSYNGLSIEAVGRALQGSYEILNSGGRVLIRDGVLPENPNEKVIIEAITLEHQFLIEDFLKITPISFPLERIESNKWSGSKFLCKELLYTINWGRESLARECQEIKGPFSEEFLGEVLRKCGFSLQTSKKSVDYKYQEYLDGRAVIKNLQGEEIWPETSAIWIGVRL